MASPIQLLSVMNGFRSELINKIVGFNSHITVKAYGNPIDEKKILESAFKGTTLYGQTHELTDTKK